MRSYRQLLSNRKFLLLWIGQGISQFGNALWDLTIVWLALELTGSPTLTGLVALCETLPFLLLSMVGGALADRLDRRLTMIAADVLRGLLVALPWGLWQRGLLHVWHLAAVAFLHTALRTLFNPAMQGLVPSVVERESLVTANSLTEVTRQAARLLGPVAAGALLSFLHPTVLLLINSLTFAVSVATLLMMGALPQPKARSSGNAGIPLGRHRRSSRVRPSEAIHLLGGHPLRPRAGAHLRSDQVGLSSVCRVSPARRCQHLRSADRHAGSGRHRGRLGSGCTAPLLAGPDDLYRLDPLGAQLSAPGPVAQPRSRPGRSVPDRRHGGGDRHPDGGHLQQEASEDRIGKLFNLWSTIAWGGDTLSNGLAGPFINLVGIRPAFHLGGLAVAAVGALGLCLTGSKDLPRTAEHERA